MRCLALFICLIFLQPLLQAEESSRRFEFTYEVSIENTPAQKAMDIFIPLPVENSDQRIIESKIKSSITGMQKQESTHSNRYYHMTLPANEDNSLKASFSWVVERNEVTANPEPLSEQERIRYLDSDTLVPVGHEILKPIQAEIHAMRANDSATATARAIYDWIVDNVEYKKTGTCNERYGNCTDFHALFIALARSEGIPARFEIGFPVPADRTEGEIGGYHCWVQFYLPHQGWIPIDASEAAKHPEHRELFYGTHPADRIHFTTGRDLIISTATQNQPLNYFIFPHAEIDNAPAEVDMQTTFSYRELP